MVRRQERCEDVRDNDLCFEVSDVCFGERIINTLFTSMMIQSEMRERNGWTSSFPVLRQVSQKDVTDGTVARICRHSDDRICVSIKLLFQGDDNTLSRRLRLFPDESRDLSVAGRHISD